MNCVRCSKFLPIHQPEIRYSFRGFGSDYTEVETTTWVCDGVEYTLEKAIPKSAKLKPPIWV